MIISLEGWADVSNRVKTGYFGWPIFAARSTENAGPSRCEYLDGAVLQNVFLSRLSTMRSLAY